MLLKAAIEPLIPTKNINTAPKTRNNKNLRLTLKLLRVPPLANQAVSVNKLSKTRVLIK